MVPGSAGRTARTGLMILPVARLTVKGAALILGTPAGSCIDWAVVTPSTIERK